MCCGAFYVDWWFRLSCRMQLLWVFVVLVLFYIGCVCCYLVFNSCSVSNIRLYISIYVSFVCSLFLRILYMWYFSNVFKCSPFPSVFIVSTVSAIPPCVCPVIVCESNILNLCYIPNCLYMLFISHVKCSTMFALRILVGNPRISFGKCHYFRIYLFVGGVLLYFVLCFAFGMLLLFAFV
jgi:hypothetical protein